jgi:two-component system, NtrC family, nitrogen regulation sensor histidine kinase GlnL
MPTDRQLLDIQPFVGALPWPCLLVDEHAHVIAASESLKLELAHRSIVHASIEALSADARLFDACNRVRANQSSITLHDVELVGASSPRDLRIVPFATAELNAALIEVLVTPEQIAQPHALLRQLGRAFAHELGNPLAGLKGVSQLLASKLSLKWPELLEYTDVLLSEVARIDQLLGKMHGGHVGERQQQNIHQLIDEALALVGAQFPKVGWQRDFDPSLPDMALDGGAIRQLLLNLLINAAQANASLVTISTRAAHQVPIGAKKLSTALRVQIADNGDGIPENLRHTLFLPLVTGKSSGSGFGLASALAIAEEHGGAIRFSGHQSETIFTLDLPIISGSNTNTE